MIFLTLTFCLSNIIMMLRNPENMIFRNNDTNDLEEEMKKTSAILTILALVVFMVTSAALVSADDESKSEKKKAEKAALEFKFYGFLKLDAAYDDSRVNPGNFARWVENESVNENDNQFNMTARQSRLGFWAERAVQDGIKVRGRAEIDFYAGASENKPEPMMRHAYGEIIWVDEDFSIVAGQTSDIISPLNPTTVTYAPAWWAGNIGYRRPQIRLTKGIKMGDDSKLVIQGAVARTIGRDAMFDPGDTGEDAGVPSIQGRIAYTFKMNGRAGQFGVSGHWGREEYDLDAMNEVTEELDTWSMNVEAKLPLGDKFLVLGEYYTGKNMNAYLGGIGQGVNLGTLEVVESTGGWGAVSVGPFDKMSFNFGASMDNPEDEDLWVGARCKNTAFWGNAFYQLVDGMKFGAEISHWQTAYVGVEDDADAMRFQFTAIYSF